MTTDQIDYRQLDPQELRDMCGSRELRYPASADKETLAVILETADDWEEIYEA